MIGQYGSFDSRKYERDFRDDFFGIEACLFAAEEDTAKLVLESRRRDFCVGVHFPFRAGMSKLRDALVLSPDNRIRAEAYGLIERELEFLRAVQPLYILFHYPKPVILDERVDWSGWRFADPAEYISESSITIDELRAGTEHLLQWLSEKGKAYRFIPVLEFDALSRYIYDTDMLEELLQRYRSVRLCLDTGRMFLQEKLDPYFDAGRVIHKYAKYAYLVHLSNLQYKDGIVLHHHPVLPDQQTEDGWAPIEAYLQAILEESPDVKIMFEHRSDRITEDQLSQCYSWVERIFNESCNRP